MYKWHHMLLVFVWLASLGAMTSGPIHAAANGVIIPFSHSHPG